MKKLTWIGAHWVTLSLAILLVLTFALYVRQGMELSALKSREIVGSYQQNPMSPAGNEYLVFDRNGGYYHYRQFEMLDQGTYTQSGQDLYSLVSEAGVQTTALSVAGGVYYFDAEGNTVQLFEKFSEIPSFVNVKPESIAP